MCGDYEVISPKESGKFISAHSKFVTIIPEGVVKLSKEILSNLKDGNITIEAYGNDGLHPSRDDPNAVDWICVADTLNFCFWTSGDDTKWKVDGHTGYYALCAALNRAQREGFDITNPKFYSTITEEQVALIMRSDDCITPVPLIPTRVKCLHEVGKRLLEKYDGTFKNCIKEANKSTTGMLRVILENFPCFRDESLFEGRRVTFYKRAQILVSDLWSRFAGESWGEFAEIEKLTMFADYRVPQALVHFGVIKYNDELLQILNQDEILQNGSRQEIEIRGCSIHAVELVQQEVIKTIQSCELVIKENCINSALIDYFLWIYRRQHAKQLEHIPFHKDAMKICSSVEPRYNGQNILVMLYMINPSVTACK